MGDGPDVRYAKHDDVHVAYTVEGSGPDLLVFSTATLPIDSHSGEPSLARFDERLASFSRLIQFDAPGVGMSDSISPRDPPTLEQWMHHAVAVLDAVGSERAAIFAPRDTSLHAILLATAHPDRIASLILMNGTARYPKADDYPFGIPQRLLDQFLDLNMEPDAVDLGYDVLPIVAPTVADDPEFRRWWTRAGNRGAGPATARAIQGVYLRADVRSLLPLVQVPTLVFHRRDNPMVRVDHGRYLAEHIPDATYVELPGADDLYWVGDVQGVLDEIEEFVTGGLRGPAVDRILTTVLFTDIVGSTERAGAVGDRRWHELLDQHDQVVRRHLDRFRGREIKMTGDGVLATFDGPGRAVQCALAMRDATARLGLSIRVGVHTGEVEVRGDDIGGMAVNLAARIESAAEADEVLVSRTVVDLIVGSGIVTTDRGEHDLKGVPGRWQLFAVEE